MTLARACELLADVLNACVAHKALALASLGKGAFGMAVRHRPKGHDGCEAVFEERG